MSVFVSSAASTPVFWRREDVGAAEFSGAGRACAEAEELRVVRVASRAQGGGVVNVAADVARVPVTGSCAGRVAGLRAGGYEVWIGAASGSVTKQAFVIAPQTVTPVVVDDSGVHVSGRTTVNGRPVEGLRIEFVPAAELTPVATAAVDSTGWYAVSLDETGRYRAVLRRGELSLLGQGRVFAAEQGQNVLDWDVVGGGLRIDVRGWDRASPLGLTITRLDQDIPGVFRHGVSIGPDDELPFPVDGLGFGTYAVQVREAASTRRRTPRISQRAVVTLTTEDSVGAVDLDLSEFRGALALRDVDGQPVQRATVISDGERLDESDARSGLFSLERVGPQAQLLIRAPGFTPACVTGPFDGVLDVTLDRGAQVTLQYVGASDLVVPAGRLVWEGNVCPLPAGWFEFGPPEHHDGHTTFRVSNFPRVSSVVFLPGPFGRESAGQRAEVSPDGVVRLGVISESRRR